MFNLTEETLKRNKSSYEQAEYQRTHQNDEKHYFFGRKMAAEKWDTSAWLADIVCTGVELALSSSMCV